MANAAEVFLTRLRRKEVLVFDGAMGTMLFAAGLTDRVCPELWNATHPDVVQEIHRGYFAAGSDFVETNTFGGTRLKLTPYGLQGRTRELNRLGAKLAREVCPPGGFVAGSIGPTGHLPDRGALLGNASEEILLENFREQAEALAQGGVDLFAIETMMYPEEAILAIRAAKEATGLPVMCTMVFQFERDRGRDQTRGGASPEEAAKILLEGGADVVGMNCGDGGPERAAAVVGAMRSVTDAPLIAYPNAGLPVVHQDGRTTYELSPGEMVKAYPAILEAGVNIVGGCCGTTPAHLALISALVKGRR